MLSENEIKYVFNEPELQAGDVLLMNTYHEGLRNRIKDCIYEHAAIYVGDAFLLEADGLSITQSHINSYGFKHFDHACVLRLKSITPKQQEQLVINARQQLGKGYSTFEAKRVERYKDTDEQAHSEQTFCSRFVAMVYKSIGIDIVTNAAYCAPDDFLSSDKLFKLDNGLQPTGQADANTWALIYSGAAKSPKRDDALQFGDFGDEIRALQERLNALGFFDQEIDGNFGYTTETAVRLFQMASSLEATGALDARTQEQLDSDKAASMLDSLVQARFTMMLDAADERTQHDVAEVAESLVGAFFGTQDDALYPGFSFVQYVCVAAGLPVTFPEDVIRMADRQVERISAVEPGDIVAFQGASADAVTILLAIGVGDDKVICTPESGGWAEYSYMDRMEGATIYCWDAE